MRDECSETVMDGITGVNLTISFSAGVNSYPMWDNEYSHSSMA